MTQLWDRHLQMCLRHQKLHKWKFLLLHFLIFFCFFLNQFMGLFSFWRGIRCSDKNIIESGLRRPEIRKNILRICYQQFFRHFSAPHQVRDGKNRYWGKKIKKYHEYKIFRGDVFYDVGCFLRFSGGIWMFYEGPGRFRIEFPQMFTKNRP